LLSIAITKYLKLDSFIKKRGLYSSQFGRLKIQTAWYVLLQGPSWLYGIMVDGIMTGAHARDHMVRQRPEADSGAGLIHL
jgi:hypothetical protein